MEFVADVLEGYPKFFQSKDLYILWTIITSQWGLDILKDLDAETVSLARIIVGYGTELVETKKLYQEPEDPHHQQVLSKYLTTPRKSTIVSDILTTSSLPA